MPVLIFKKSLFFIIAVTITLSACQIFENPKEKVVITVGSSSITDEELRREIQHIIFDMGVTDQEAKNGIEPIINKVVEKSLIMEYGKEKGITVTDRELESAIREIKRDYPEEVFQEMRLQRYIDFNEWKDELTRDLLIKKIITIASSNMSPITFSETKAYFDARQEEFWRPQTVQLRQIVTRSREDAEKILERLAEGHDMGELAKKYSITPESGDGGILGWIEKGELEEPMEEVIFSLPAGKISDILKTPYGYHIFEVLASRPGGSKELPEVMTEIESELILQKRESFYGKWIKELRAHFPVTIEKEIYKNWSVDG